TSSTNESEHSEFVPSSSFITESFEMTDDSEEAKVQPSENLHNEISLCVISETTETEIHIARKSTPTLETDTEQTDVKTTVTFTTEILPEPVARVCEPAVPKSSHDANETEKEKFVSVALETKPDIDEKMPISSSPAVHSLESTVQGTDVEFHSTEGQESQLSIVVVSSDSIADRVESENTEAVTAEPDKEKEEPYISQSQEEPCGVGEAQTKKVAALILDLDTVHVEGVDTPSQTPTDGATRKATLSKQDHETLSPPEAISEVAIEPTGILSSLNEPSMVNVLETSPAIEPEQSELIDIDTNGQVQKIAGPPTETQGSGDAASGGVGTFSWNNGPNAAIADRESNWTTNNGPHEIQRRYIILDFPEEVEMQRHHVHEATLFREPSETQIQGLESSVSESMEIECDAKTETGVITSTNRALEASEQSELVEANLNLPTKQVGEVMHFIVEEDTKKTPSGNKTQLIESDLKRKLPVEQQNKVETEVQTKKVYVSTTVEEKPEGEEAIDVEAIEAQSKEIQPKLTPPIKLLVDWDTEIQPERIIVSLTPEEKPEVGEPTDIIVEEEMNKTPSGEIAQFMESEPKMMPSVRRGNDSKTDAQSNKVNVSTQKEKAEDEEAMEATVEETKTTLSDDKAQCIEAKPELTPSINQQNDQKTEVQSEKVDVLPEKKTECEEAMHVNEEQNDLDTEVQSERINVLLTPEEKHEGGDTAYVIVEEETTKTPSDEKAHSIEAETKPTPPVRRQNEGETKIQVDKLDVTPTPPTRRRKDDRLSLNIESQIEGEVLPTPPSRRRREKMGSERFLLDLEFQPTPPARQRKEKEDSSLSLNLETLPTPPARRRKEKEGSTLSLNLETLPTPPARRRKEKGSTLSLNLETLPTPPARRRKEKEDRRLSLNLDTQPTPPARRRKEKEDSLSHNLDTQPTPPARRRKEKEDSRLSLDLETQPTPPARRRKEKGEDERLSVDLEPQPTPPSRRRKDKPESDTLFYSAELEKRDNQQTSEDKDREEHTVKPTPPTRRKDSKVEEIIAGASNLKEDISIHKPAPPLRRKDSRAETEMVSCTPKSKPEEVLPTPPTRQKKDQVEAERVSLMLDEPQVIPTPTTSDKESSGNEKVFVLEVKTDIETITKQEDKQEWDRTLLVGKEQQKEKDSDILVAKGQPEEVLPTPPTRRKKDQVEADKAPSMPEETQIIPTPATSDKESSGNEKVSVSSRLEVETDVEAITKQEDKQECDTKSLIGQKQQKEEQDSGTLALKSQPKEVLPTPPTKRKKDQGEGKRVPLMPEVPPVILTPTTSDKESSGNEKVSVLEVKTDVETITKQEDKQEWDTTLLVGKEQQKEKDSEKAITKEEVKQECATKTLVGPEQQEEGQDSDTLAPKSQPEEVLPTPPTRRKKEQIDAYGVPLMPVEPPIIPTAATSDKESSGNEKVSVLEVETDVGAITKQKDKEECVTKSLVGQEQQKEGQDSDTLALKRQPEEVLPTPPTRRKKDQVEADRAPSMPEEPQIIPIPATSDKESSGNEKVSVLEVETDVGAITKQKDKEECVTKSLVGQEQQKEGQDSDTLALKRQPEEVLPTPPTRRKKDQVEADRAPSMPEELQIIPIPATSDKESSGNEKVSVLEVETDVEAIPKEEDKEECDTKSLVDQEQQKEGQDSDTLAPKSQPEEVLPTPPTRQKKDQKEADKVPLMPEEPQVIPTPTTSNNESSGNERSSVLEVETDVETITKQEDKEEHVTKSLVGQEQQKERQDSDTLVPKSQPEEVLPTPPTRQKKDQKEADKVPLMPEEPQVIPTPTTSNNESSGKEKVSVLEVETDVEKIAKQEDKEEYDTKSLVGQEQQEEGKDSDTLVPEPSVISHTESISEMQLDYSANLYVLQPQDQDVDVSPQVVLVPETTESQVEEELVFHLLDLRTCPAALNSIDMAKQLEQAEECRRCAQRQVSMLSRQGQANGDIGSGTNGTVHETEGMQQLSAQWSAALWDAASSVHSKEAQLQMVADFDRQTQKVKAILERLKIQRLALRAYVFAVKQVVSVLITLKAEKVYCCTGCKNVKIHKCIFYISSSPAVSSFSEEERLRSFLRNMEQERTALGELIQIHAKLSPHLSVPERQAAEIQQNNLQSQWRALEKNAEIALNMVNVYAKESSSLIQEISSLKDHLENIQKTLDALKSSPVLWDGKRVQEIMNLNADLTSTHQHYLNLQQTSEALAQEFQFEAETSSIEQDLQVIKGQLDQMGEQLAAATPSSSNPTLSKIVKVMTDALAWAKQTECDVKGRQKKVSLLPEEVHRQIKDLKKLQSEMSFKQTQLKALVEEVTELICDLDEADVSMVTSSLKVLENLSKSTAGKLAEAVREMESGLQTREKMSEQIADVDSWVVGHLQKEALRREDYQSLNLADLDRRLRLIQDTLGEAEKQSAVTEALLMKSRDIASELRVSENTQLYEKLTSLQEDIKGIVIYEKACSQKVMDVIQSQESSQRKVSSLENSLRQMLVDVKRHRFPVTKDTLSVIEPFKQMLVERKSQVEQVSPCAEDKRRELLCVITELYNKMIDLDLKSQAHERYLSLSRCLEDVKEEMEAQIPRTKDESISKEERYRACQALLIQISLIKHLCEETMDELQEITADLYPTQISAEQTRFQQILESLKTSEMAVNNNLQILEWDLLKRIHYPSEKRVLQKFLKDTNEELEKPCSIEPKEAVIEKQLRKCLVLRKNIGSRMRVLEFLEKKTGAQPPRDSKQLTCLKDMVLEKCDQRM
ncbi:hypothetical protein M9458_027253, partial [Cirrhinus mrigala]